MAVKDAQSIKELCRKVVEEQDPEKFLSLIEELSQLFEEEDPRATFSSRQKSRHAQYFRRVRRLHISRSSLGTNDARISSSQLSHAARMLRESGFEVLKNVDYLRRVRSSGGFYTQCSNPIL
jgi:hypothetical protein